MFDLDPEEPPVEDGGGLKDESILEGLIKEVLEGGTATVEGICAVLSGWSGRNDVSVEVGESADNILQLQLRQPGQTHLHLLLRGYG